jgi:hypothetical protein
MAKPVSTKRKAKASNFITEKEKKAEAQHFQMSLDSFTLVTVDSRYLDCAVYLFACHEHVR